MGRPDNAYRRPTRRVWRLMEDSAAVLGAVLFIVCLAAVVGFAVALYPLVQWLFSLLA